MITINNEHTIHGLGNTLQLFLYNTDVTPVWFSTDETVATVDENGLVTGVSAGTVMIGTMINNKFHSIVITVEAVETTIGEGGHTAYESGDVDGNCTIDVEDAVAVLTYYAQQSAGLDPIFSETPMLHAKALVAADVNGDNVISIEDAVGILTYYAQESAGLQPTWAAIWAS